MKRIVIVLLLLPVLASLAFALRSPEGEFEFYAYYNASAHENNWLELDIYDGTNSMKNAAIIQVADPSVSTEQSVGFSQNVFHWELSGNYDDKVTITINFLPLQAFKNGTYYIPKHKFTLTYNPIVLDNLKYPHLDIYNELFDTAYYSNWENKVAGITTDNITKTVEFSTKEEGNYPYLSYGLSGISVSYSGFIWRAVKNKKPVAPGKPGDPDFRNMIWTRSGVCSLTVLDYDTTTEGDFDYVANISITITVDK